MVSILWLHVAALLTSMTDASMLARLHLSGLSAPPPLHHTTNLTTGSVETLRHCVTMGACATAYKQCDQDVECSAVMSDDLLDKALRQRRSLPLLARNDAMRTLTACADAHCFERACYHRQDKVATHASCPVPPCYLTNDLVRTNSADECEARCLAHAPPIYPELCAGYTWVSQPRLDDRAAKHTCFLVSPEQSRRRTYDRGAISGHCFGGPHGETLSTQMCNSLSSDPKYLKAWLRAKRRIVLEDRDLDDLFNYIAITGTCPLDRDFDETLDAFRPRGSVHQTRRSLLKQLVAFFVDIFEALVDFLHRLNPSLYLTLLIPLYPKFRSTFPKIASLCSPLLDRLIAQHAGQHAADHASGDLRSGKAAKQHASTLKDDAQQGAPSATRTRDDPALGSHDKGQVDRT